MQRRKPTMQGQWSFGGDAFADQSALAAELGRAIAKWGFAEYQLDALFADISVQKNVVLSIREHVQTPSQRHKILSSIVASSLSVADAAPIKSLLSEFKVLARQRNEYVHAQWGNHTAYPDEVIYRVDQALLRTSAMTLNDVVAGEFAHRHKELVDGAFLVSLEELLQFNQRIDALMSGLATAGQPFKKRAMLAEAAFNQIPVGTGREE